MKACLLPEELIAGIISVGDREAFPSSGTKIQKAFFRMSRDPEYKESLKMFRFSGSPAAPFSKTLDAALFNLQFGKKLNRPNLDMKEFKVNGGIREYFETNVQPKLSDDRNAIDFFKKMSQRFLREVND